MRVSEMMSAFRSIWIAEGTVIAVALAMLIVPSAPVGFALAGVAIAMIALSAARFRRRRRRWARQASLRPLPPTRLLRPAAARRHAARSKVG